MAEIKIAGVMRAGAYSPNHIGNDAAIFNATADQLRKRGCSVTVYSEEQFRREVPQEEYIVNMCRERESIELLQSLEEEGRLVINSGFGIANCTRERMTRILQGNGIPYPDSLIVDTDEYVVDAIREAGFKSSWIKRGDSHSLHMEDVSYCRHPEEAQDVLKEYFYRGIKRAVINRHLVGDLVKFYGIAGTNFFYQFYPFDVSHSKYGLENINGPEKGYDFDLENLKETCQRAAEIMDVKIYGGDVIVATDGTFSIIDFNDWPSFAPCRGEAAPFIAKEILQCIKKFRKSH